MTAGAQERELAPFPGFDEEEASSFTVADWFGMGPARSPKSVPPPDDAGGFVAEAGSGRPTVETSIDLKNCETRPELSITYTFFDVDGIQEFYVSGSIGIEWVSFSPKIEPGDTQVEFAKVFDLSVMRDEYPAEPVQLTADVSDTTWNGNWHDLELYLDFERCSYFDVVAAAEQEDYQDPVVTVSEPVLSACDSTPTLEVKYLVTDRSGIVELDFLGPITRNVDVDFAIGDTRIEFTELLPIDDITMEISYENTIRLDLEATDATGRKGLTIYRIKVDLDACTYEYIDVVGDGSGPSVVIESLAVNDCASSSPKLSVTYTATDPDGLVRVGVSPGPWEKIPGFAVLSTTATVDLQKEFDGNKFVSIAVGAMDELYYSTNKKLFLTIDYDACSYTFNDGESPTLVLSDLDVTQCDVSPLISITYVATDTDGFIEAQTSTTIDGTTVESPIDLELGATRIEFTQTIRVDDEVDVLRVKAFVRDASTLRGYSNLRIYVDRDKCRLDFDDLIHDDDWTGDPDNPYGMPDPPEPPDPWERGPYGG